MKRIVMLGLILFAFAVSAAWAQTHITGGGTPNAISVFTGPTTIGDSPLIVSNDGNIGYGDPNANARLQIYDFRENGNAMMGLVTCKESSIGCIAIDGHRWEGGRNGLGVRGANFPPKVDKGGCSA